MKLLFVSLGCDKNIVDSEEMLGLLTGNGFEIVDDETEAEAIVVNTCCFINDAKEESVNTILEMAEYKMQYLEQLPTEIFSKRSMKQWKENISRNLKISIIFRRNLENEF